jgi:3-oxoacyl-[acyl-carrier-protein] synthase III
LIGSGIDLVQAELKQSNIQNVVVHNLSARHFFPHIAKYVQGSLKAANNLELGVAFCSL